jgi:hypothetical protein
MFDTGTAEGRVATGSRRAWSPTAERFVADLDRIHHSLTYKGLPDAVSGEPLCRLEGFGDGLTTVSVRESQLPERYLRGVMGFRLVQFLRIGWMDPELVQRRGLYHEPFGGAGAEAIHTVTLTETGRIVGYIGLVGSPDPVGLRLDDPSRGLFPAESAHHVDLVTRFATPERDTHQVYELKRFVRDRAMGPGDQRNRVPWHLILSLCKVGVAAGEAFQVIVGDSRENGALRHLRLVGFDPVVIDGTEPSLPRSELMWPSYEQSRERLAKPFAGLVPDDLADTAAAVEEALGLTDEPNWQTAALLRVAEVHRAAGRLEGLLARMAARAPVGGVGA